MMKRLFASLALLAAVVAGGTSSLAAQGVTTSQVRGVVRGPSGGIGGARIVAVHQPSGTRYIGQARGDGRYAISGMRVGGPYTVTATAIGFQPASRDNVFLTLGEATDADLTLAAVAVTLADLTVEAQSGALTSTRTGAATQISREVLTALPTVSRRISDLTRLTPQARGGSFAGIDDRLNNITVDGAYFNNSFGLSGAPGDRTGVSPIPLDALEQITVNIAPYDVRQGNFIGAGVNTVTKSGTNEFSGSAYMQYRNEAFVGTEAKGNAYNPGTFKYDQIGLRLGGPIIKNKLFFFGNFEDDGLSEPGTPFVANPGGVPAVGNTTRVLKSELDALSTYLKDNFDYDTGPYQDYDSETPSRRFIGRLDFNASDRTKFSLRYVHLDSDTDVLLSNSTSLGFGNRRGTTNGLNFQNSNYQIKENIRSLIGEMNTQIGSNMANNFIVGYTSNDESRAVRGSGNIFPFVDILKDGATYTSFGYEPFTPNNELRYKSQQLQNNFTIYGKKHDVTFGVSVEKYRSENVFFSGSQSVYIYNSLEDFYTDANGYIANPNRTTSPVTLRRFQVRWSNIPGQDKPLQPLEVLYAGAYAQDEFRASDKLKLTLGVRVDAPSFGDTGFENPLANAMTFQDEDGNPVQYRTEALPERKLHFSPRLGFNFDVKGDRSSQIRGGTGVFTGRPAYVWISNQIGENGVLTGFEDLSNTTARPWNPNVNAYKPTNVTGAPAAQYGLAYTDPDFKFPQIWRTNIAIDQKLPWWGLVGTAEYMYSKDVNGVKYINANLKDPTSAFTGADTRERWLGGNAGNRIQGNVSGAFVLKNQDVGSSWNYAFSLEKPFTNGFYAKAGYSFGESKNLFDPGSIAAGSWQGNPIVGDPNNPELTRGSNSPGHRFFTAFSVRKEYLSVGATTISVFINGQTQGYASYVYNGDMNGEGALNNDLIYVPANTSEMVFEQYTSGGRTYTAAQQTAAWEEYIKQDPYLSTRRGQYAERNGLKLPMLWRADLSITQDLFTRFAGKLNNLQVRVDMLNFTNFINNNWGVSQRLEAPNGRPLSTAGVDANGAARFRMNAVTTGGDLVTKTFNTNAGVGDVWRFQLGLRYTFN
ncbi:MAG: carboxypeptidase regulatory-like domain-containing protein [Gemmatimonadales bacterium]|nr:carboxypeptidase regulatory-like domain-containing protein [Gemmatimonadales bacterium]